MTDDSGLTTAVASPPRSRAAPTGAARNCHAETPAARATISSDERVRRQKQVIPPTSTAKGRISMAIYGMRSEATSLTRLNVASALPTDRRSSSMKSNSDTSPVSASTIAVTAARNCRLM